MTPAENEQRRDEFEPTLADRDRQSPNISLRASHVAFWAVAVAIASITALTVIAARLDAAVLSTVALTLAILAFVIQIVVYVFQNQTSSEQMMQSERLNNATRSLLGKIEATNTATLKVITDQFNFVLRHALGDTSVPEDLVEDGADESRPAPTSVERERLIEGWSAVSTPPRTEPSGADAEVIANLDTYPPEEQGLEALGRLDGLPLGALFLFRQIGAAERMRRSRGISPWITPRPDDMSAADELLKRDLLKVRRGDRDRTQIALSDLGHATAPVLTGRPPKPAYVSEYKFSNASGADNDGDPSSVAP